MVIRSYSEVEHITLASSLDGMGDDHSSPSTRSHLIKADEVHADERVLRGRYGFSKSADALRSAVGQVCKHPLRAIRPCRNGRTITVLPSILLLRRVS